MIARNLFRQSTVLMSPSRVSTTTTIRPNNLTACAGIHLSAQLEGMKKSKKGKKGSKQVRQLLRPDDVIEYIDLEVIEDKMKTTVANMKETFSSEIRLSSDVSLFESISLTIDNDVVQLNEIADINQVNPRLIAIDMTSFPEYTAQVVEVLQKQKYLSLNPMLSGSEIKVALPQVTSQQSSARMKQADDVMQKAVRALGNIKTDAVRKLKKVDHLPKDSNHMIQEQLDIYVQNYTKVMKELLEMKKKSLKL